MELSNSQEEYLKIIYNLSKTEKEIRVTDIANKLQYTKPSVNFALKSLKDFGLVNYEPYKDITLTKEGKQKAQEVSKRYDIVKMFLTEVLEVEERQAQKEAKAMKHAISKETEEKLERYISKELNLEELECGCDIKKEKCRSCARISKKNRKIERKEEI